MSKPHIEVLDRMGKPVMNRFLALGKTWRLLNFHFSHNHGEFPSLTLECAAVGGAPGTALTYEWRGRVGSLNPLRERVLSALRQLPSRLAWAAVGAAALATGVLPEMARLGWWL